MPQNKKYLAQKEKEDHQKRIIVISTIAILVVVFSLIAYAVLESYVLKPRTVVIELDSRTINAVEFEQQVRYQRFQVIKQTYQMIEFVQSLGGTPDVFAYFEQQMTFAVTQLSQPILIGQEVVQSISDDLIIETEAEKLGIEVNESQVNEKIQSIFGYFPDGTPVVDEPIPASTETAQQPEDTSDGVPDPTATPLLLPTEYTLDLFEEDYQNYMDLLKFDGIKEKTFRDLVRVYLVRDEMVNKLTEDLPQTEEQVWISHILVEDEETALEVAGKLADGEDFATLSAEYSLDDVNKDLGGDLGWFARGAMVLPFEKAAFALEEGEISDPVQTDFGWHILKSLGKGDHEIDPAAADELRNNAFNDWLIEKRTEYQVEVSEDWTSFIPDEPVMPQEVLDYIQFQSIQQPSLLPETPQE
ncbi:MAG: peptidylprolyl isomerase [Anaerolineales bacterium]|nr:peptidylprolyl isomerase [Anaerolineales bacterium]